MCSSTCVKIESNVVVGVQPMYGSGARRMSRADAGRPGVGLHQGEHPGAVRTRRVLQDEGQVRERDHEASEAVASGIPAARCRWLLLENG